MWTRRCGCRGATAGWGCWPALLRPKSQSLPGPVLSQGTGVKAIYSPTPPRGNVASAKASEPRPALATSFVKLAQFSFKIWLPFGPSKRRGRERGNISVLRAVTSPLRHLLLRRVPSFPNPGLYFIRSLCKILPLMSREWLGQELVGGTGWGGGGWVQGGSNHPWKGRSELLVLVTEGI